MSKKIVLFTCCISAMILVGCATGPSSIKAQTVLKTTHSWNGAVLPAYPKGQPEVTILRIEIPPQAKLPIHTHPEINAGILLRGQLTVVTSKDGKTLHLKAGDPISEVVNTWHYGKNEGDTVAEIIVFYAGIKGQAITIKKKVAKASK